MIVSASYKTDIPAFYGRWFLNRLEAGHCLVSNAFNRRQVSRVSLRREDVDGFVFWTKNLGPFMAALQEVHGRGFPFVVQYSINGYPRQLEYSVTDAQRAIEHCRTVAGLFGPNALVWRYDPIVFTSATPAEVHRENFAAIARELAGLADEVVISFAQIYKKTRRNMDAAAREFGFGWSDPDEDEKRQLLRELVGIARESRMKLTLCSQPELLEGGATEARCIDAARLARIAGHDIAAKLRGSRKPCGCYESKDIGDYDTCPHGCVYCYAVQNRRLAQARFRKHDPESEFLFEHTRLPAPKHNALVTSQR